MCACYFAATEAPAMAAIRRYFFYRTFGSAICHNHKDEKKKTWKGVQFTLRPRTPEIDLIGLAAWRAKRRELKSINVWQRKSVCSNQSYIWLWKHATEKRRSNDESVVLHATRKPRQTNQCHKTSESIFIVLLRLRFCASVSSKHFIVYNVNIVYFCSEWLRFFCRRLEQMLNVGGGWFFYGAAVQRVRSPECWRAHTHADAEAFPCH